MTLNDLAFVYGNLLREKRRGRLNVTNLNEGAGKTPRRVASLDNLSFNLLHKRVDNKSNEAFCHKT